MWQTATLLLLLALVQEAPPHPTIPVDPLAPGIADALRARFLQGLEQAETFRASLLDADLVERSRAFQLGELIERFRAIAPQHLAGRPGVDRFSLDPESFAARVRGTGQHAIDPDESFGPFAGRWYGLWEQSRVDHDWSQVSRREPPAIGPEAHRLLIRAMQSAWIGDGFGWNVIAVPESGGEVILGTVYHVEPGQPDRVRLHRPHVGVAAGPGLLIWVTASEVFLEEVLSAEDARTMRYVITGFRYELQGGEMNFTGAAFQAVYTRNPQERPEWYSFPMEDCENHSSPAPSDGGVR